MKKILGAFQSVLIATILLAVAGTGVIIYFQMNGKTADPIQADSSIQNDTSATDPSAQEPAGGLSISVNESGTGDTASTSATGALHEHNYTATTLSEATCTKDGATQYICGECGNYYIEPIKAKGHSPSGWTIITKATKDTDGLQRKTCLVCKRVLEEEVISKDTIKNAPHVHQYTSSITTETKCITSGVRTYKCDCGKSYTESIPATNHQSRQTIQTAPACDKEGSIITSCAVCGAVISHDVLKAPGHRYGKWQVVTKATATTDGKRTRVCSVCKYEDSETIPALNSPAGSAAGHTHRYTSAVTTEETCTADGVLTYSCNTCDNTYTEPIPALGHAPSNWITVAEPTETTEGKQQKVCRRCGEVAEEETLPAAKPAHAHNYGTPVITKQATCTATGTRKYTCTECGNFYTSSIDKLPHKPDPGKPGFCGLCKQEIWPATP